MTNKLERITTLNNLIMTNEEKAQEIAESNDIYDTTEIIDRMPLIC